MADLKTIELPCKIPVIATEFHPEYWSGMDFDLVGDAHFRYLKFERKTQKNSRKNMDDIEHRHVRCAIGY